MMNGQILPVGRDAQFVAEQLPSIIRLSEVVSAQKRMHNNQNLDGGVPGIILLG
jgi:hypothetical protein